MQRLSNQICHKFEWFEWQCLGKRVFNFIKNNSNKAQPKQREQQQQKTKTKTKTRQQQQQRKKTNYTYKFTKHDHVIRIDSAMYYPICFNCIYSINKENN